MVKPFVVPSCRDVVEKVIAAEEITLPNGYKIRVKMERISHTGRSIYREFDDKQVVLEILNRHGEPTKRMPIPGSFTHVLMEKIERVEGAIT